MSTTGNLFLMVWFVLVLSGSVIAIMILRRRGARGWAVALIVLVGAAGSYPLFTQGGRSNELLLFGAASLLFFGVACFGLVVPKRSRSRCPECGYDLSGATEESGTRCPECGAARPEMEGRCLECKADIRQALAAGSIVCPGCKAKIAETR